MMYKFKKYNLSSPELPENEKTYEYSVDYDTLSENDEALIHLGSHLWTPENIQEIIDKSNSLEGEEDYTYQVEGSDFFIAVKRSEVLMWARDNTEPDITWPFDKFIEFMEAFKKFVSENL